MEMFNFRIIKCANGVEVIDSTLSTPYNSLTPIQMMEYIETENSLFYMDCQKHRNYTTVRHSLFDTLKCKLRKALI